MIVRCRSGAQVVIGEMPWVRHGGAAYLAVGNARGSQGATVDADALGTVIDELSRVRALLLERQAEKQAKAAA